MFNTTHKQAATLVAPLILAGSALAGGEGWITNMDEAMKIAQAENKMILMDFTGSDWCVWCHRLNDEVFSQSMFQEYAPEKFVLVELDFPSQKELSEEQIAHNEKWRDKVGIEGYPTILLADPMGEEFARTGYQPGGAASYIDHLDALLAGKQKRDETLAAAARLEGVERAKMLDKALNIENITVPGAEAVMEEIIALDADDAAGLKSTYSARLNEMRLEGEFMVLQMELSGEDADAEAIAAKVDSIIAEYAPPMEMLSELTSFKIYALSMAGKHEAALSVVDAFVAREDVGAENRQMVALFAIQIHMETGAFDKAIEAFERAVAYAPNSDTGKLLTSNKQSFLEAIKQARAGGG